MCFSFIASSKFASCAPVTDTSEKQSENAAIPPSEVETKLRAEIENINKEIGTLKEKNNEMMVRLIICLLNILVLIVFNIPG